MAMILNCASVERCICVCVMVVLVFVVIGLLVFVMSAYDVVVVGVVFLCWLFLAASFQAGQAREIATWLPAQFTHFSCGEVQVL